MKLDRKLQIKALCLCTANSTRSQMGEGLLRQLAADACPHFPGPVPRLHCGFTDPAAADGDDSTIPESFKAVRDDLELNLRDWLKTLS